ncbi:GntR family transcriptional regulator [Nocardia sp. NPDC046763]|uniref:GntR family transcriptional regulator n=1 Tax=Nocardia sp. NPDC046763 TaxID=3155256 RepID=UPI0033D5846C
MTEPKYVQIANKFAREIRSGAIPSKTWLPSYADIASENDVSEIVVRKAVDQLHRWGLVRKVERRGTYVLDRPNLVRLAPERQMEAPETTYGNESDRPVSIEREVERVQASAEQAEIFGIDAGDELVYVVTRAAAGGQPVSISDTYHLPGQSEPRAAYLEETLAERVPEARHAEWLKTPTGDPVTTIRQRFLDEGDRLLMTSDVSYPRDRYQAFSFRMALFPVGDATL